MEDRNEIIDQCYIAFSEGNTRDKAEARQALANWLIEKYHFLTIHGRYDEVYYYNEGIYRLGGDAVILNEVESILGELSTTTIVNEILNKIKRITKIEREDINNVDSNYLCLNNGIYDLDTNKFFPHNHEYRFIYKIITDYNKEAKCPKIIETLNTLLPEETLLTIQELTGYCLLRNNSFKKAFIIEGPGDSGKTTYINLLTNLLGIKNVATSSLQYLCDNKHGTSTLYGKMANLYDDLDVNTVKNAGMLKMITGDGYIPSEKKYADSFPFKNEATICFTCNNIPKATSPDITYYKRFIILLFHYSVEESKQDKKLLSKLLPELSGFLNWGIEGLQRLIKQNKFTYTWTPDQVRDYMQASCSSIAKFIQDELKENKGQFISRKQMFSYYIDYCQRSGIVGDERESESILSRNFLRYCAYTKAGQRDVNNKKTRVWLNVSKKDSSDFGIQENPEEKFDFE